MTVSYVAAGFAVGLLVGLTGVGGGSLMTPLLTLLFGVSPTVAVGTDLAFASTTKAAGTLGNRLRGTVQWNIVRHLCIGALPTAGLAIALLYYAGPSEAATGKVIRYAIAASVLLTVVALLFRTRLHNWALSRPELNPDEGNRAGATIGVGAVLGLLVTVSSIGAGAIGATILALLYPRLSSAEVSGTGIAYAVPITAAAALGHWWLGTINWELLAALLLGSVPGITLGALAAKAVPERILRALLATALTGVAAKMVF